MKPGRIATCAALAAALFATAAAAAEPLPLKVVERIPGPGGGWDYASVAAAPHRLYVARSYGVMAVDLATGKVTPKLVDGQRVHAVLPIPGGDLVLSTNGDANTAVLFHGTSGAVVATLATGKKPDAAVFDPATGLVFVMDGGAGQATLIDPVQAKVVGTIEIGGKLETPAVDGHGAMFVNIEDKGELVRIDTRARKVTARWALEGCTEPSGLAYSAKARLVVAACANGAAKIVSPDGHPVALLKTGEDPDAVIYDAGHDRAYIPSPAAGGTLTAIALSAPGGPRVEGSTATETGARTGAFDPKTGRIYLPTASRMETPAGGGRAVPAPGTFEVVVVGTK